MAKSDKKDKGQFNELPEVIENVIPKSGPVDLTKRVKVVATKDAPFHKEGQEYEVAPVVAEKMRKNGWAK